MKIIATSSLKNQNVNEIWEFLHKFSYLPYQQFPEYSGIENLRSNFFIAKDGGDIVGWVQVVEKKNVLAIIEFGPMGKSAQIIEDLFQYVLNYYKNRFYLFLRWVPYWYESHPDWIGLYEEIFKDIKNRYSLISPSNLIHWSSKRLLLKAEPEVILKGFSENHRRNIKKAIALQLDCKIVKKQKNVEEFISGYVNMYQHRKLNVNASEIKSSFFKLHEYLQSTGRGFFMGAFKNDELLGGLIIIFQGDTAFYYKGYINHEQRSMPINHIAFYKAMLYASDMNMKWFDLGGYALQTTDEQLIGINKFKDGFKGELVEFSKTQMIGLNFLSKPAYFIKSFKFNF